MNDRDEEYWPRLAIDLNGRPLTVLLEPGDQVMLFDPDGDVEVAARIVQIEISTVIQGCVIRFEPEPAELQP